ncbi:hypothetical protein HDK64DRAFT_338503 [Phyllosticta capitalensis]
MADPPGSEPFYLYVPVPSGYVRVAAQFWGVDQQSQQPNAQQAPPHYSGWEAMDNLLHPRPFGIPPPHPPNPAQSMSPGPTPHQPNTSPGLLRHLVSRRGGIHPLEKLSDRWPRSEPSTHASGSGNSSSLGTEVSGISSRKAKNEGEVLYLKGLQKKRKEEGTAVHKTIQLLVDYGKIRKTNRTDATGVSRAGLTAATGLSPKGPIFSPLSSFKIKPLTVSPKRPTVSPLTSFNSKPPTLTPMSSFNSNAPTLASNISVNTKRSAESPTSPPSPKKLKREGENQHAKDVPESFHRQNSSSQHGARKSNSSPIQAALLSSATSTEHVDVDAYKILGPSKQLLEVMDKAESLLAKGERDAKAASAARKMRSLVKSKIPQDGDMAALVIGEKHLLLQDLITIWPNQKGQGGWLSWSTIDILVEIQLPEFSKEGIMYVRSDQIQSVFWASSNNSTWINDLKSQDQQTSVHRDGNEWVVELKDPREPKKVKVPVILNTIHNLILALHVGAHWVAVEIKDGSIAVFDSMSSENHYLAAFRFAQNLVKVLSLIPESAFHGTEMSSWKFSKPRCPQQNNSSDCGLFAINSILKCARGVELSPRSPDDDISNFGTRLRFDQISVLYKLFRDSMPDTEPGFGAETPAPGWLHENHQYPQGLEPSGEVPLDTVEEPILDNERRLVSLRAFIADVLEQKGYENDAAVIEHFHGQYPHFNHDERQVVEELISYYLNADERFQNVEDDKFEYCPPYPGSSITTRAISAVKQLQSGHGTVDDITQDFGLIVSVIRISGPRSTFQAWSNLFAKAQVLFGSWSGIFWPLQELPSTVKTAQEMTIPCWHSFVPNPQSSAKSFIRPRSNNVGPDSADGVLRGILDKYNDSSAAENVRPKVLFLQTGLDGTSTSIPEWESIQKTWPSLEFHITIACNSDTIGRYSRFFIDTDGTSWGSFEVDRLISLARKPTIQCARDAAHIELLIMLQLINDLKTDFSIMGSHALVYRMNAMAVDLTSRHRNDVDSYFSPDRFC